MFSNRIYYLWIINCIFLLQAKRTLHRTLTFPLLKPSSSRKHKNLDCLRLRTPYGYEFSEDSLSGPRYEHDIDWIWTCLQMEINFGSINQSLDVSTSQCIFRQSPGKISIQRSIWFEVWTCTVISFDLSFSTSFKKYTNWPTKVQAQS